MAATCGTRLSGWFLPGLGLVALLLAGAAPPARAQVLVVSPDCGVPGQTLVTVKGSGWPEPDPPCEYVFYFNGSEVAPRQDDGLFGPPAATFTVPSVAPGKYRVKVELRITETQELKACREVDFCVIAQEEDPWANGLTVVGNTMIVQFDPTNVCDVTPCQSIVLLQSINLKISNGVDPPAEVPFTPFGRPDLDANRVNGIRIDTWPGERDPYFNGGRDRTDRKIGKPGKKSCSSSKVSIMQDTPRISDAIMNQLPNGTILTFVFEVNAYCAAGDDRGSWLGQATWTWSRSAGQAPVLTSGTPNRNGPSPEFTTALTSWNSSPQHRFNLPTPKPPTSGGQPCR